MALSHAIPGVILAGGLSSRMGQDKTRIRLGGCALIDRAARRLRPQVSSVTVNANGPMLFERGEELPVFADLDAARAGPLGGVLAALDHARRNHPEASHVATVPTDSPFFPTDLVRRLSLAIDTPERIAVARSASGLHPVFALWPIALAGDLADWLAGGGALRVRSYLERHQAREIAFPLIETPRGEFDPFFNINTPDDLDEAENWLWVLER
ncbi:molybdenum cofactor guanylyltransferase MobA [Shinella sp. CPCC 101442]|uniref:molybdenum cofactor guanylyltransferase MobA n=1 Tax=Shinella sp. CPCC 101442 TaxID=2932265 RepID=UPI00215236C1|nr:molybdenum cofactor guanylyltransferase MobA [Shinella sp. CPCC 101442]MCR6499684.1 molybdenum cofactor guanylyltransferase MobA [Shinella sp. CPCC 101442]